MADDAVLRDCINHLLHFIHTAVKRTLNGDLPEYQVKGVELEAFIWQAEGYAGASWLKAMQRPVCGSGAISAYNHSVQSLAACEVGNLLGSVFSARVDYQVGPEVCWDVGRKLQARLATITCYDSIAQSLGKLYTQHTQAANADQT